jgi:hypothetical protein
MMGFFAISTMPESSAPSANMLTLKSFRDVIVARFS